MSHALADLLVPALAAHRGVVRTVGGEQIDGPSILALARQLEQALLRAGALPGDALLVRIDNRPRDLAALLAIWLAGAVAVPVHHEAPPAVVDQLRRRTGARLAIDGGEVRPAAGRPTNARVEHQDAAMVVFTSGTTGRPKGVVLGHDRFRGKVEVLDRLLGLGPDLKVVLPLRLTFIFGIWAAILALIAGASLTLMPRFERRSVAEAFGDDDSVLVAVPTMLRLLLAERPAVGPRAIVTGGELLPAALARTIQSIWPRSRLFDLYGLSETGSCDFCLTPDEQPAGFGTIGRPTEGVSFRITDAQGRPVPDDQPGELQIRSRFGMLGYLDEPASGANAFSESFFRTGDLVLRQPSGWVKIVGRIKEIISRGGTKIAPAEIEAVLEDHPGVAGALCAGVPDALLGEAVHVLVVPRMGTTLDEPRLREWAAARLERHKLWDDLRVVDALPVGPTGKLDRHALTRAAHATSTTAP